MSRALTILKYVPAVLCGLLVVAWAVSVFASLQLSLVNGRWLQVRSGSCWFGAGHLGQNWEVIFFSTDRAFSPLGNFCFGATPKGMKVIAIPLAIMTTFLLLPA